jgi:hypothetical protein
MGYVLKDENVEEKISRGTRNTDEKLSVKPISEETGVSMDNTQNTNKKLSVDQKLSLILKKQTEMDERIKKLESNGITHLTEEVQSNMALMKSIFNYLKVWKKEQSKGATKFFSDAIDLIRKEEIISYKDLRKKFSSLSTKKYKDRFENFAEGMEIKVITIEGRRGSPQLFVDTKNNWVLKYIWKKQDLLNRKRFIRLDFDINKKRQAKNYIKNHKTLSKYFETNNIDYLKLRRTK